MIKVEQAIEGLPGWYVVKDTDVWDNQMALTKSDIEDLYAQLSYLVDL